MKAKLLALSGLIAILGIGMTFGVSAQTGIPQPQPPAAARMQKHEHHPELQAALKALRKAKSDLQKAARDFDGHRAKAVDHTDEAIKEVEAAIASDKK
jgi:hypothetical protein